MTHCGSQCRCPSTSAAPHHIQAKQAAYPLLRTQYSRQWLPHFEWKEPQLHSPLLAGSAVNPRNACAAHSFNRVIAPMTISSPRIDIPLISGIQPRLIMCSGAGTKPPSHWVRSNVPPAVKQHIPLSLLLNVWSSCRFSGCHTDGMAPEPYAGVTIAASPFSLFLGQEIQPSDPDNSSNHMRVQQQRQLPLHRFG